MRLTIVGSSDAFNSTGRFHSCYLLEGDGFGPIMIDFGATALAALRRIGREPTEVKGFALTHLHGDHAGGFPFLVIDGMFHAVRRAPLEVVGPLGAAARIDAFVRIAYGDVADRPRPFDLAVREIAPGEGAALAGATLRGFAAEHMDPPEQPLCLRVVAPDGRYAAFSGDTAMCEGLLAAADGAEVLVAECSCLAPPCGRHCTWEDWLRVLPSVGARRVVLTHLGTAVRERVPDLLAAVPAGIDVTFADDGMVILL
jgi:ribonuclease BN (tRNA processing enzyme)